MEKQIRVAMPSLLPGLGPAACLAGAARAPAEDGAEDAAGHPRRGRVHVRGHVLGPEHLLLVAARLLLVPLLLLLLLLLLAVAVPTAMAQHANARDTPGVLELRVGILFGAFASASASVRKRSSQTRPEEPDLLNVVADLCNPAMRAAYPPPLSARRTSLSASVENKG